MLSATNAGRPGRNAARATGRTAVAAALLLITSACGGGGSDGNSSGGGGSGGTNGGSSGKEEASSSAAPKVANGVVQMTPQGIDHAGIKLARAVAADSLPLVQIPATIAPPLGARRAVAAPYPGVVREVRVVEGQAVRSGQVLAVVISPTVLQTGADLQRARAMRDVNASTAHRTRKLVEAGVVAGAREEEATANLRQAETSVAENQRLLSLAHADARSGTYSLVAPISGHVSAMNVTLGQPIDNSAAPFVIDAAGQYALSAQLPQDMVGQVAPGMQISVGPDVTGTITAVGMTVDEQTRAVPLHARIAGAPGIIAGKSLMATVLRQPPAGAVQVPSSALVQIKQQWVVFVPRGKGFAPHRVDLIGRNSDRAVVTGLPLGTVVVGAGASELKSALTSG